MQTFVAGKVVRMVSDKLDGEISFEKIHLKPFTTLVVKNVNILDRNPFQDPLDSTNVKIDTFFRADYIIATFTFDGLFRQSGIHLRSAYIENAQMNLVLEEKPDAGDGDISTDNLSRIFRIKEPEVPKRSEKEIFRIRKVEIKDMGFAMKSYMSDRPLYDDGMDWNDLDVKNINIKAEDLRFKGGIMSGKLESLNCNEKSGYVIEDLTGRARVGRGRTLVEDLHIDDPWSDVHLSLFSMTYENVHAFQDFISLVKLDGKIEPSLLDFETLSYFAPELKGNRLKAYVSGSMSGPVDDFTFSDIRVESTAGGFSGSAEGRMTGLPDIEKTRIEATLKDFSITSEGLGNFLSEWTTGDDVLDIGRYAYGMVFKVNANGSGLLNKLKVKAAMASSHGSLMADVLLEDILNKNIGISGAVETSDLDLGRILGMNILGPTTLRTGIKARIGTDDIPSSLHISYLNIDRLYANGYDYKDIAAVGTLADHSFDGRIISQDPNLNFMIQGTFALSSKTNNTKYQFYANLGHADLHALNIDKRGTSRINFQAIADFTRSSQGDLRGKIDIGGLTLENSMGRENIGDISLNSYNSNEKYIIRMDSRFANGRYSGTAPVTSFISDLRDMTLKKEVPALFADSTYVRNGNRYELKFSCGNSMSLLNFVMPGLYIDTGTELSATLGQDGLFNAGLRSNRLAYGMNYLKNVNLSISSNEKSLETTVDCDEVKISALTLTNNKLKVQAEDNRVGMKYSYDNTDEEINKGEFILRGDLSREDDMIGAQVKVLPSAISLNSKEWNLNESEIILKGKDIRIPDFTILSGEERIKIYGGISHTQTDTLALELERFDMSLLNTLLKDDLGIKGFASGKAELISPLSEKGILADIICDSSYIAEVPIGVMTIGSRWDEENNNFGITAFNELNGRRNMDIVGTLAPKGSVLNATAMLDGMKIDYVKPFMKGIFSQISGEISGSIDMKGPLSDLVIASNETHLDNGLLTVEYTNVPYHVDGAFHLDETGAYFDDMAIRDRYTGNGKINGKIGWNHFRDIHFDTHIRIQEMEGINLNEHQAQDFYGRVFGTGNVSITGPVNSLLLSVDAVTAKRGELHIPLASSASAGKQTNLLRFKEPPKEVRIDPYEEMMTRLKKKEKSDSNFDVRLRVNAQPEVEVYVEIDKATGNVLSGHGSGLIDLEVGTDRFAINGDYTLSGGNYKFVALGLVSRDFTIQDGSSIRFNGDIMQSTLNIDAIYRTKASLSTLLSDMSSVSSKRNVDCMISITDKLTNPRLQFGIDVPDLNPMVKSRVESALSTEDKVQKQFLSLIVSNNFLPDEQSGIVNNSSALYSNVTEMFANQLNNIFHKLDIPLDLGLNYQPTERGNDLFDVAVTTHLFNNRVAVNGNIGNKQYTSGNSQNGVVGDLDIEIKIDRSGAFRLNLFSHSADQFSNYLDNSQRNGIGLMYQTEFNNFSKFLKNIFMRKSKRQEAKLEEEQAMLEGGKVQIKIAAPEVKEEKEKQ